jgi:hypothetical protein
MIFSSFPNISQNFNEAGCSTQGTHVLPETETTGGDEGLSQGIGKAGWLAWAARSGSERRRWTLVAVSGNSEQWMLR